jgi:hypothetical protein
MYYVHASKEDEQNPLYRETCRAFRKYPASWPSNQIVC